MFGGGTLLLELVIAGIVAFGVRHLQAYEQLQAVGAAHAKAEALGRRRRGTERTAA